MAAPTVLILLVIYLWSDVAVNAESPRIQPFSFNKNITLGRSLKKFCAAEGQHPLSFEWKKDGRPLHNSHNLKVQHHDDYSILIINSVDSDSNGNYTCVVRNSDGFTSYSSELAVQAPPKWSREPVDVSIGLEGKVILDCEVKGHPRPMITWTKVEGDERQLLKSAGRYQTSDNGSLVISDVRSDDAGTYECSATNGIGTALTKAAFLSVHVPAKFTSTFAKETVRWGETAILQCEAFGDRPITLTWTKDRIPLAEKETGRYETFHSLSDKSAVSELHIQASEREDNGLYVCVAKNAFGKDERTVKLVVIEVPGPPSDVRVEQTWSQSATVRWSSPYGGNSPITSYVVQFWRDAGAPHRLEEVTAPSTQTFTMLKDLQPGTSYIIRVVAENEVGRGNPSESQQFLTKEAEPSGAPTDVTVESRGAGTLLLKWKSPPKDQWNGQLKGYYIGYQISDSSEPYSFRTVDSSRLGEQEEDYKLSDLQRATEYRVIVQAFNGAGGGPASQDIVAKTSDTDPPPSPFLWVDLQSRSSIGLKWKHPISISSATTSSTSEGKNTTDAPTAVPMYYTLFYKDEYGPWSELTIPKSAESSYTLNGLREGTRYQLYLRASSEAGESDPSDILTVRTEGGALSDMSSHPVVERGRMDDLLPSFLKMSVVVPLGTSVGIILVVLVGACFYVRKAERRNKAVTAGGPDRHYSYGGSSTLPHPGSTHPGSKRYMDIEKNRPLLLRGPGIPLPPQPPPEGYPLPYATMPLRMSCTLDSRRKGGSKEEPHSVMMSRNGMLHQAAMDRKRRPQATIEETAEIHEYDIAA